MMGDAQSLYASLGFHDIAPYYDTPIAGHTIHELRRLLTEIVSIVPLDLAPLARGGISRADAGRSGCRSWHPRRRRRSTVLSREGRKPLPVTTINNQDYIAVDDVNAAFATTSREDRLAGGLTITARGRSIVLTENQNVVSVAGRLVTLPAPPVRRDGRWFVPADFLPRALAAALDTRLDLRRPARLLIVGDLRVPRVVARIDAGANNVAVTFDITPNTETRVNAQQGRLIVQFDADALDLSIPLVPPQALPAERDAGRYAVDGRADARPALRAASRHDVAARCRIGPPDDRSAAGDDGCGAGAGAAPPPAPGYPARDSDAGPVDRTAHRRASIPATAATSSARRARRARSKKRSRCRSRAACAR